MADHGMKQPSPHAGRPSVQVIGAPFKHWIEQVPTPSRQLTMQSASQVISQVPARWHVTVLSSPTVTLQAPASSHK
jgi:hypothetical protein